MVSNGLSVGGLIWGLKPPHHPYTSLTSSLCILLGWLGILQIVLPTALIIFLLIAGEAGFGLFWEFLYEKNGRREIYFTSTNVMKACENQNIPVSEILNIKTHCDISACFDPPLQLSEKLFYLSNPFKGYWKVW